MTPEPRSRVIYPAFRVLARGALSLFCRVRYRDPDRLPASGPLILAANHQSFLDPFLIGAGIGRRPRYLVYYTYMESRLLGRGIRFFGSLPVGKGPPARSLRAARQVLDAGGVLEIFPEGQRSDDGRVLPFQRGFARLACATGTPVLPVAIVGAHAVWPPARRLPRPGPVQVLFGEPLAPPAPGPRWREVGFAEEVRQAILGLADGRLHASSGETAAAGEVSDCPDAAARFGSRLQP